ncbi:cupin domain-containing protein [Mangrovibacterium lignilyticum]|uniref:cupin domain-containing protein n=1 Tax=Mangrovibacterium lignilyticum TaxID=2668052 RepID=UPI0013D365BE|nr:cupin domain-containing protein [Mangrovibacterium lignilyticum]
MRKLLNNLLVACTVVALFSLAGCSSQKDPVKQVSQVFQQGQLAPAQFFTGNAYVTGLVSNDSVFTTAAGEVYFEAGARSNWHLHPSGQILIVTSGVGYHQLIGEPIEVIHKGDVVKCPPNVLHWHGASKDSAMSHIYIVPNTEKGIVEWKQPVTDEEYLTVND